MPIYWSIKQIPELAHLSSAERNAAWRRVYPRTYRHWETWLGLLLCAGLTAAGSYIGKLIGTHYVYPAMLAGAALGGLASSQATMYVICRYHRAELSKDR